LTVSAALVEAHALDAKLVKKIPRTDDRTRAHDQ